MNRQTLLVLTFSTLAALGGLFVYLWQNPSPKFISAKPTSSSQATTPWRFEDIVLKDVRYQPRHLSEWKQPLLMINLWAPWCAPCRREVPALIQLQRDNAKNLQIIGLSFDAVENVVKFQMDYQINYPLLLVQSEAKQLNQFFGNSSSGLPFTAILNQNRNIVYRHSGEVTQPQLQQEIDRLLASE